MKKFKEEKGITLVALIITIVVLLILAVVAIGTVRDSNIIGHAQNAAGSFNQAKANEIDELTNYEETINKYVPKESKIEYYIMGTLENPGYAMIQRLDFDNYMAATYNCTDGIYTRQTENSIPFEEGEKVTEETIINVQLESGVTPLDMKGGYQFLVNGYASGYIKDKILYVIGEENYYCFELVEDGSAISAIEAGIVSIK